LRYCPACWIPVLLPCPGLPAVWRKATPCVLQTQLVSEESAALPQLPHGFLPLFVPQGVDECIHDWAEDNEDNAGRTNMLVGGEAREGEGWEAGHEPALSPQSCE